MIWAHNLDEETKNSKSSMGTKDWKQKEGREFKKNME